MTIVSVDQFSGADASEKAKNALASRLSGGLLGGPTILDFRNLADRQSIIENGRRGLQTDRPPPVFQAGLGDPSFPRSTLSKGRTVPAVQTSECPQIRVIAAKIPQINFVTYESLLPLRVLKRWLLRRFIVLA